MTDLPYMKGIVEINVGKLSLRHCWIVYSNSDDENNAQLSYADTIIEMKKYFKIIRLLW